MPKGVARYQLAANPYDGARLNPLDVPADADRLVPVGGYQRFADVDAHIAQTVQAPGACFFLVTGRSGAGRTAIANAILARYRHHRDIEPGRLFVPHHDVENHDAHDVLSNWLVKLRNQLRGASLNLPEETLEALKEALEASERIYRPSFTGALDELARQLALLEPQAGFGVRLERAQSPLLVNDVFEIFASVRTAVVFTAYELDSTVQTVIQPFASCLHDHSDATPLKHAIVRLEPLDGEEARLLIEARWQEKSTLACPFDGEGVTKALGTRRRPVGTVLRIAGDALETRAADEGGTWPEAHELALSGELLGTVLTRYGPHYD